jgi:TRAP-type mannitol/chloroaromatic compound transport system permease small subunit
MRLAGLAAFVRFVDRLNDALGRAVAWLTLAMVLIAFAVVILRYIYAVGWVWMQESYVWLHGIVFMLGAGYTLLHNGHVRVDIIYRTAGLRYKAVIDLLGSLLLLVPMVVVVFKVSEPYVAASWQKLEESRQAGGLPGLFLLKTVILAFCVLLGLQGLALAGRSFLALAGRQGGMPVEDQREAF